MILVLSLALICPPANNIGAILALLILSYVYFLDGLLFSTDGLKCLCAGPIIGSTGGLSILS